MRGSASLQFLQISDDLLSCFMSVHFEQFCIRIVHPKRLLDIEISNSDNFISNLWLYTEIVCTPGATNWLRWPEVLAGRVETLNKSGRQEGRLRAKLRLSPRWLSLPSISLASVRSLAYKMDELRITVHKRIMDCNVMIFM